MGMGPQLDGDRRRTPRGLLAVELTGPRETRSSRRRAAEAVTGGGFSTGRRAPARHATFRLAALDCTVTTNEDECEQRAPRVRCRLQAAASERSNSAEVGGLILKRDEQWDTVVDAGRRAPSRLLDDVPVGGVPSALRGDRRAPVERGPAPDRDRTASRCRRSIETDGGHRHPCRGGAGPANTACGPPASTERTRRSPTARVGVRRRAEYCRPCLAATASRAAPARIEIQAASASPEEPPRSRRRSSGSWPRPRRASAGRRAQNPWQRAALPRGSPRARSSRAAGAGGRAVNPAKAASRIAAGATSRIETGRRQLSREEAPWR